MLKPRYFAYFLKYDSDEKQVLLETNVLDEACEALRGYNLSFRCGVYDRMNSETLNCKDYDYNYQMVILSD